MTVTVGNNKARASIQIISPVVSTSYVQVSVASVDYILLAVDAQLDVRGLYPIVRDTLYCADARSFGYAKSLTEAVAAADQVQPFLLGKGLTESQTTDDSVYSFLQTKPLADPVDAEEAYFSELEKPFADGFTRSDATTLGFGHASIDTFNAQDGGQEFEGDYYADLTYFAEKYVAERRPIVDFFKAASESLGASDSGYLYLSSYVDPSYFETDYAGTYQSF